MGSYRNKELVRRARELRNNMTKAEIILWSRLRSKKVNGHKFRRQQPLLDYIVDFYCDELKLIIEVDGEIHSFAERISYDSKRDKILKLNGFHIIRLSNLEVETELNSTIMKITTFITEDLSPHRRTTRGHNNEGQYSKNDSSSHWDNNGSKL
jgi:very-short-patch-repair endonuclease